MRRGCFTAIASNQHDFNIAIVEKKSIERSGSVGIGFDHQKSVCTNPCLKVTPEKIAYAYIDEQAHFSNGIFRCITCKVIKIGGNQLAFQIRKDYFGASYDLRNNEILKTAIDGFYAFLVQTMLVLLM